MEPATLQIHPLTDSPTAAWREISKTQKIIKINVKIPQKPVDEKKLRFVCMSDTHSLVRNIMFDIPDGDVFIHAGDFTKCGQKEEKKVANQRKDIEDEVPHYGKTRDNINEAVNTDNIRQYLTNCIYLEDSGVEICGIKIYGTPWQPEFGNWAFNLPRGRDCLSKWNLIPEDTDILVTHTPPLGHGDLVCSGVRAGCVELLTTVQTRVKPKYHIFGHIHEGYGVTSDGKIIFINASTCDINYIPNNLPVVFDICIKSGHK
ncbi:UPF0046 protein T07D4.2 isoform X2 [Euwallacea fornicatus]|uniref:UPF0046 protein T07D4.2 isoform X2 n=1 Tax=Euwallacea fornicatus TaxID=995702 RepID=UPI00338FB4E7